VWLLTLIVLGLAALLLLVIILLVEPSPPLGNA
jgi:hypothetical protein